jgi:signal transduction histidine kinase
VALTGLGILYLSIGVYGYAYCARSGSLIIQIGYFFIQILLGWLIIFLSGQTGYNAILLLPLAGHSVVLLTEPWWYLVNGVLILSYIMAVRLLTGGWDVVWTNLPIFLAGQIAILVFTQMTLSEERARRGMQKLATNLESANQQLQAYVLKVEDLATEKERIRLAREIHDGLGHHLTALNMQIRAANAVLGRDTERAKGFLQNAEAITQRALVDVRQSVTSLRERTGDSRPLIEQIESVVNIWRSAAIDIQIQVAGEARPLSPMVSWAVFRGVQEALSNSAKHSEASRINILLNYMTPDSILLEIIDNGLGAESITGGYGLIGIQERIEQLDGNLSIITEKGKGFKIEIRLPTGDV